MQSPTTYQIVVATAYAHAFNFWLETRGIKPEEMTAQHIRLAREYAIQMASQAGQQWETISDGEWAMAERAAIRRTRT